MEEWDELPWWKSQMYLMGLKDHGVIQDGTPSDEGPAQGAPGKPTVLADYASGMIPKGFKRRRT